jgi:hypothetical protein
MATQDGQPGVRCACAGGEAAADPPRPRGARAIRTAIVLAVVVALAGVLKSVHAERYLLELVSWIRGAGWIGMLAFAYALGLTRVSSRDYVLGSLVGMLPGTIMYVYLGSLITSVSELAAGRASGGAGQQVFYFAGLAATGPIGCEMAQTFRRFGSEVTLFEAEPRVLPREDADAAAIVERRLAAEGVRLVLCGHLTRAERRGREVTLHCELGSMHDVLACDAVLLAIGRAPNVEGLGLEAAGVAYDRQGITVSDHLRTTNRRVYAAGDVASRYKFTHVADALARIVLQNALFLGRKKASALRVPWCTYTSPEIAHVGLYEHEALARGLAVDTITIPMSEVDRAVLEGEDEGFLRVHLAKGRDRILGATLVASRAGDMISEVTVAMAAGRGLGTIAAAIHPYPTQAEVMKKAGDAYNRGRLTPRVRWLFERWLALRR